MWQILQNAWRPAVEILILTVSIYYAFRFVRGTRGAPVVTGFLVVLLALGLVSFLLKLKVLQYLLGAFSAFFVLAVLVIFQPELRRMLAELGNLQLFASAHEQRENIEVIIQTVERLAEVRIGALIALEQSIHLQEAVESGIVVDCEATPEMLETIFFPNNAIHDGGVIIRCCSRIRTWRRHWSTGNRDCAGTCCRRTKPSSPPTGRASGISTAPSTTSGN